MAAHFERKAIWFETYDAQTTSIRTSLHANKAIELKHLRLAVAAADCGSLRQAAALLNSQQSSISRRIGEREHHFGVAVFKHHSGGVRPTRAGSVCRRLPRNALRALSFTSARTLRHSSRFSESSACCDEPSQHGGDHSREIRDGLSRLPRQDSGAGDETPVDAGGKFVRDLDGLLVVDCTEFKLLPFSSAVKPEHQVTIDDHPHPKTRMNHQCWSDVEIAANHLLAGLVDRIACSESQGRNDVAVRTTTVGT